jgi:hypothetical protein
MVNVPIPHSLGGYVPIYAIFIMSKIQLINYLSGQMRQIIDHAGFVFKDTFR